MDQNFKRLHKSFALLVKTVLANKSSRTRPTGPGGVHHLLYKSPGRFISIHSTPKRNMPSLLDGLVLETQTSTHSHLLACSKYECVLKRWTRDRCNCNSSACKLVRETVWLAKKNEPRHHTGSSSVETKHTKMHKQTHKHTHSETYKWMHNKISISSAMCFQVNVVNY